MKNRKIRLSAFFTALLSAVLIPVFNVCASQEPSFGEKMAQAGRNTVIGLVTVFVILLLLSFVISLFRFIAPKKKAAPAKKTEYVNKTVPKKPSADDEELAAVIIAAICAAEGTDYVPGQYRLKSIKSVKNTRSWNRARRVV